MSKTETRIKSSQLSDYEALGVSGEPIYRASSQIITLIEKELGVETASIFAIPIRDDKNNIVDWYSTINGKVSAYKELSQIEKSNAWNILNNELNKVKNLSSRLLQNVTNETSQTYGKLLQGVQHFPGSEEFFVINNRPVITFWGFKHHGEISQYKTISEIVEKPIEEFNPELPSKEIFQDSIPSNSSNSDNFLKGHDTSQSEIHDTENDEKITFKTKNLQTMKGSWWRRFGWWCPPPSPVQTRTQMTSTA
jgi:hypothetical protein